MAFPIGLGALPIEPTRPCGLLHRALYRVSYKALLLYCLPFAGSAVQAIAFPWATSRCTAMLLHWVDSETQKNHNPKKLWIDKEEQTQP